MEEIIDIPALGEARLSLNEYDKMRDRIRELEDENKRLTPYYGQRWEVTCKVDDSVRQSEM